MNLGCSQLLGVRSSGVGYHFSLLIQELRHLRAYFGDSFVVHYRYHNTELLRGVLIPLTKK